MDHFLECVAIDKTYDGTVHALQDVSLTVRKGRVHAIIGENGAGKSTLAKILGGMVGYDSGLIRFKGREYRPSSPRDAAGWGIGMVHQHFMQFPSLSVAENIILGREPVTGGRLDMERARREVRELSVRYGMPVDPREPLGNLAIGDQQKVEILKALHGDVDLLIFDEPTAVLTPQEVEKFFKGVRRIVKEGCTVIVIAHKLEEVLAIANDITVLRKGRVVGTSEASETSREELVRLMVGGGIDLDRERGFGSPAAGTSANSAALTIDGLTVVGDRGRRLLDDIHLEVSPGEIVGIAGVEGNGQAELELVLGGVLPAASGSVRLGGRQVLTRSPRQRRAMGLAYIPADRMNWGCAPGASIFDNSITQCYRRYGRFGLLRKGALRSRVTSMFERFDVRAPGLNAPMSSLSGGNIQKLILGRELTTGQSDAGPRALVVAQPTRGIDIRGVEFIHDLLCSYRDAGCAVLLISTDLDEIVALSDRIAVLASGRVEAVLPGRRRTGKEELGRHMLQAAARAGGNGGGGELPSAR